MESSPVNQHNDQLVITTGKHGADITSQRIDDLDREALRYALYLPPGSGAVDLGCGRGVQGLRFAFLGLKALLTDLLPIEDTLLNSIRLEDFPTISYLSKDARYLVPSDLPNYIALLYSQRFIHYLRFGEALNLLNACRARMRPNTRLFLSASGLRSELGDKYPHRDEALDNRFAHLAEPMAQKHNILVPVCLYLPNELVALCHRASFTCEAIWTSEFGNVKGVFTAA